MSRKVTLMAILASNVLVLLVHVLPDVDVDGAICSINITRRTLWCKNARVRQRECVCWRVCVTTRGSVTRGIHTSGVGVVVVYIVGSGTS